MQAEERERAWLAVWSVGLGAVVLAAAAWWLARNDLPDGYQNEFIHLYTLVEIFFRWRDDSIGEAWPFLWDEYYPPLLHFPGLVGLALADASKSVATLSLGAMVLPLLVATGLLGRRVGGAWVGAWAVTLVAFAPAVFGNVRRYEPNVALAAWVALALWWLSRDGLSNRREAMIFGLLCGAGLLVDRLVFAVYLAAPVAVLVWRHRRWRVWGWAAGITVLVTAYYYVRFLALHLGEITSQLGGEITAQGEESGAFGLLSLRGLLYYPLAWIDGSLGLIPSLIVFAGFGLWVARARRDVDPDIRAVLESALIFGGALFTVIAKKQPYYAIPLIAPAAVCAVAGWAGVVRDAPRSRAAVLGALSLLGANQLVFLSTGTGLVPMPGRWAVLGGASPLPDGYLGHEYVMAGPPFAQGLDLQRAARLCREAGGAAAITLLFSEGHAAYEGQMMPTLRLELGTRRVPGMLMEPQAWEESAAYASCFVYVARERGRDWPTPETITRTLDQWSYDPPSDGLLGALESARDRANLLGVWASDVGEVVHVYALGPDPDPDQLVP